MTIAQRSPVVEEDITSPGPLVRAKYLAKRLDVPESTAFRWIADGRVPGVKRIGRMIRLDRDEIERWIAGGCQSQAA